MRYLTLVGLFALSIAGARAEDTVVVSQSEVEAVVSDMFKSAADEWKARVAQDETQQVCSQTRNMPSAVEYDKIKARELATIQYPADEKVLGDWRKGETIAQTGAGGQFSDPPDIPNGGNCYACHQMAKSELSYGTLGPSLLGYGRDRKFDPSQAKLAYAKIFNSQSVLPCSNMPRFGAHKFLTIEQIKDVTAYLMSPDSPVNR